MRRIVLEVLPIKGIQHRLQLPGLIIRLRLSIENRERTRMNFLGKLKRSMQV